MQNKEIEQFLKLLDMVIVKNGTVNFTKEAKDLIHKLADSYKNKRFFKENQDMVREYEKDKTAEDVYLDMLIKIAKAPTTLHMMFVPVGLVPIISKKLRER